MRLSVWRSLGARTLESRSKKYQQRARVAKTGIPGNSSGRLGSTVAMKTMMKVVCLECLLASTLRLTLDILFLCLVMYENPICEINEQSSENSSSDTKSTA